MLNSYFIDQSRNEPRANEQCIDCSFAVQPFFFLSNDFFTVGFPGIKEKERNERE